MKLSNTMLTIFLDKLVASYPRGIAKNSLVASVSRQSAATDQIRCIVFVDGETKPGGTEYEFVKAVCEKGLELDADDYRLQCGGEIGGDIQTWLKATSASIVISFQNGHRDVRGETYGSTTHIQAPGIKTVSASVEQKRLLWEHLKPLRLSRSVESSVNRV